MQSPATLRDQSILRAEHTFRGHFLPFIGCPLCPQPTADVAVDLGVAVAHEAGEHLGRPVRDCGYCALYVLRPVPVAPIARRVHPLALPAPRRRAVGALPAARTLFALPERATRRFEHREAWLSALRDALRPAFLEAGAPIPAAVRVTCGFPSHGARSAKQRVIGQCHYQTADKVPDLCVSPVIEDVAMVAATLLHELIHAAYPADGHGVKFGRAARKLGLLGSLTATTAGAATLALLAPILAQLGPYPHSRIDLSTVKRQGTRMLLLKCPEPECGYQVRTTAKWLAVGVPTCPCGTEMVAPELGADVDEAAVLELAA